MTDTIAAIATAVSNAGISIIRVSGSEAIQIVDEIFVTKGGKHILNNVASHTIHYGFIQEQDEMIDEVMVSVMKAPKSYTAEDVVEINCHGGVLVTNKILKTVLSHGARIAEPGEFTKRAFLNGRIDLTKAEAIMDLIEAKSDYALKASENQLQGKIYDEVVKLRKKIIYEIAFIESAIDDPEHISLDGYTERLMQVVDAVLIEIEELIKNAENGKLIKEGIDTVIVGKPNAGKSSLLNRMLGEEKAIVTDIAGTTRDIIQESMKLGDISLNLIDTAGIHETNDVVEKIGVGKAKECIEKADLVVYVVDASVPLDESDQSIIEMLSGKKVIVLLNKSDMETVVYEQLMRNKIVDIIGNDMDQCRIISTSTKEKTGLREFEEQIRDMFFTGEISFNDEILITNVRQERALVDAKESLCLVKQSLEDEMPEDFYSIDLMNAYASLGSIIGEEVEDDLVQEIFSKFCMGK
ncbi:MAG: tRNA uridine-5-carboxymethylaminomethyl(34) synthesis GTPase MnmE [Firmicutes bacterium CAG:552_39_19]|nr:MAG: tRNA uridine-5-carboxymethylaminomethyl(34) synthesis GTPase MnmE [Firmicutes bacterium CAG:552_39_19]